MLRPVCRGGLQEERIVAGGSPERKPSGPFYLRWNEDSSWDWIFDGASLVPDKLMAKLFHIPHLIEIPLKHDLKYAYGELGNEEERLRADHEFKQDLLVDGTHPLVAKGMFTLVRRCGNEKLKTSFSWGFARIHR